MHRLSLHTASRCVLRHSGSAAASASVAAMRTAQPAMHTAINYPSITRTHRSVHTTSVLSSYAATATAAASVDVGPSASSVSAAEAAAALLNGTPQPPRRVSKKARKARAPRLVNPLLGRIWCGATKNGVRGTVSPDDWKNVITLNRQRLLQMKEKEQFSAWKSFQRMKEQRLAFLAEKGETPSPEMLERIQQREAAIMQISAEARAQLNAPIPEQKQAFKHHVKNARGMKESVRALSHPQTFLPTAFPNESWRVFSFKLTHYHSHILHKQMEKFRHMAKRLGLSPSYPTYLPHKVKKFTIIRSPHVDKTSREQYETRLYSLRIHISTNPEKFYAIQRLSELAFRLINGPVRMHMETPPNVAIETFTFAPNPMKVNMGHTPAQIYAERDSPGIENILYKFDQHQFPFLKDWEEEILDEKYRGIYAQGRDVNKPLPMLADIQDESEDDDALSAQASEDDVVFDEQGEFQLEEDLVGEDESTEIMLDEDAKSESEMIDEAYKKRLRPLVKRRRRSE